MANAYIFAVLVLYACVLAFIAFRVFSRRGRSHIGPAASGAFHDLLTTDKRKASQIVIEERAGAHDPEDAEGDLPSLSGLKKHGDER